MIPAARPLIGDEEREATALAWAALALAVVQIGLTAAFVAVRRAGDPTEAVRSEEHTSELQSH